MNVELGEKKSVLWGKLIINKNRRISKATSNLQTFWHYNNLLLNLVTASGAVCFASLVGQVKVCRNNNFIRVLINSLRRWEINLFRWEFTIQFCKVKSILFLRLCKQTDWRLKLFSLLGFIDNYYNFLDDGRWKINTGWMKVNKKLLLEPRKKEETFRRYLENKKHSWVLQETTEAAATKRDGKSRRRWANEKYLHHPVKNTLNHTKIGSRLKTKLLWSEWGKKAQKEKLVNVTTKHKKRVAAGCLR